MTLRIMDFMLDWNMLSSNFSLSTWIAICFTARPYSAMSTSATAATTSAAAAMPAGAPNSQPRSACRSSAITLAVGEATTSEYLLQCGSKGREKGGHLRGA